MRTQMHTYIQRDIYIKTHDIVPFVVSKIKENQDVFRVCKTGLYFNNVL